MCYKRIAAVMPITNIYPFPLLLHSKTQTKNITLHLLLVLHCSITVYCDQRTLKSEGENNELNRVCSRLWDEQKADLSAKQQEVKVFYVCKNAPDISEGYKMVIQRKYELDNYHFLM